MIVIYLGDTGQYLADLCLAENPQSILITKDNFADLAPGTYYTSLGDLETLSNFAAVLRQADKIIYAPPEKFADTSMAHWYHDYLKVFQLRCKVENFHASTSYDSHDSTVLLELVDQRKTNFQQLWIAGCSISNGAGVGKNDRYGQLIADRLHLDVSFLTKDSSSIIWAADQILRSDIRPKDIVVWGITAWSRMAEFHGNRIHHINTYNIEVGRLTSPDFLSSDQLFYQTIISIFQVINFCAKIGATLILVSVLDDVMCKYLQDHPNFLMLYKLWGRELDQLFIDLGTDDLHPGVLTHQFYADQIYQKIQQVLANT